MAAHKHVIYVHDICRSCHRVGHKHQSPLLTHTHIFCCGKFKNSVPTLQATNTSQANMAQGLLGSIQKESIFNIH